MLAPKKNVLLPIDSNTYFRELYRLACRLQTSNTYRPILFFHVLYPTYDRDLRIAVASKLLCLGTDGQLISPAKLSMKDSTVSHNVLAIPDVLNFFQRFKILSRRSEGRQRLLIIFAVKTAGLLRHIPGLSFFIDFTYYVIYLRHKILFIKNVIHTHHIQLLASGGDLVHYVSGSFIRGAHQLNVPSIIVPCTMSNALEMAESFKNKSMHRMDRPANATVGKFFPHWVYNHHGKKLLRLPGARVLAMEYLKLSPPLPWINNSGFADRIAAESSFMKHYYTREGIPESQVAVTGSAAHDQLAEAAARSRELRTRLAEKYHFSAVKPILLSALPPDQHYLPGGRSECDFPTYKTLIDFWVHSLAAETKYTILISLHPSVTPEEFKNLNKLGIIVVDEDITSLIPICDLFVASVSSVIRWAIACGKPVINFDVYRFHYNDYNQAPGVLYIEEQDQFLNLLRRLAADKNFYQHVAAQQSAQAAEWAVLDGHAVDRITNLFTEVIEHRTKTNTQITSPKVLTLAENQAAHRS